jgi:hypothetical protein
MNKFAVRLEGQPVWFQDNQELLFDSEEEAFCEIALYLDDCAQACEDGYMEDDGSDCDFRVVEVLND